MEEEKRDLLNRLFAVASDVLERAHEAAMTGQAPDLDDKTASLCGRQLARAAEDIGAVADTIRQLVKPQNEIPSSEQ
ncbi:hypothetical protein [Parvibaculum sp.]|uniref:hypothetical protein n=1 Tax=Parvibaculum sp. TaxID=2024848 RepID=UPI003297FC2C